MATVRRNVGVSVSVTVEVENPGDDDAVENALAEAGVIALKEVYGISVKPNDIIIFDEGGYDEEE